MNISLPDTLKSFAEEQGAGGEYANVSDYVRDLIRMDQRRKKAIAEIQVLLDEGDASGSVEDFDMKAFIAQRRAKWSVG